MADYNIYIHAGAQGQDSPTTPKQLKSDEQEFVKNVGSFIQNPDSLIGGVFAKVSGALTAGGGAGIGMATTIVATKVTLSTINKYFALKGEFAGQYQFSNEYNNLTAQLRLFTQPFSSAISYITSEQRIRKEDAENEQKRALFGGTFLNSRNGRFL